jgi:hypothetical protein
VDNLKDTMLSLFEYCSNTWHHNPPRSWALVPRSNLPSSATLFASGSDRWPG